MPNHKRTKYPLNRSGKKAEPTTSYDTLSKEGCSVDAVGRPIKTWTTTNWEAKVRTKLANELKIELLELPWEWQDEFYRRVLALEAGDYEDFGTNVTPTDLLNSVVSCYTSCKLGEERGTMREDTSTVVKGADGIRTRKYQNGKY